MQAAIDLHDLLNEALQLLKALAGNGRQGVRLVEDLDGNRPYIPSSTARLDI